MGERMRVRKLAAVEPQVVIVGLPTEPQVMPPSVERLYMVPPTPNANTANRVVSDA